MAKDKAINLNAKQEKFAQEVVKNGGDKVQAFKDAGWSWENFTAAALCVDADKKFNKPNINLRIRELQQAKQDMAKEELSIDAKWLLQSAKKVFDRCIQEEQVLISGEPSGEYKFDSTGANKALDIIGKHVDVNAFKEVVEHKHEVVTFNMKFGGADAND